MKRHEMQQYFIGSGDTLLAEAWEVDVLMEFRAAS